ncbi:MAG TPA: cysteine dioxygenase family protein [bacterium]|nr:cysteine dioxygenase family protein [bacterium]
MATQFIPSLPPVPCREEFLAESALAPLVAHMKALTAPPKVAQVMNWLESLDLKAEDLAPFISYREDGYNRCQVFLTEFQELLVLSWLPGQVTPIHDHVFSIGAIRVVQGPAMEQRFCWTGDGRLRTGLCQRHPTRYVAPVERDIVHQIWNPGPGPMVTLHLYSPPLAPMNIYDPSLVLGQETAAPVRVPEYGD